MAEKTDRDQVLADVEEAIEATYEVAVWYSENSQPIVWRALALYEKGSYTCIVYRDRLGVKRVRKIPTKRIWAVDEEYVYIGWTPTSQETEERVI